MVLKMRVKGHKSTSDRRECTCGWVCGLETKKARRAAYTSHLQDAFDERHKGCRKCSRQYSEELPRSKSQSNLCLECGRDRHKKWVERNPEETRRHGRRWYLREQYGMSLEQFDKLLEGQGGVCAICGSDSPRDKRGFNFHIDHDHVSGRHRGILCGPCNRGLGHFHDSITNLRAAADYLEEHS